MNHILPQEYNSTLTSLFQDAPTMPYQSVIQIFKEEFNAHPDDIFEEFDPEPIASASIAQVHRATLKSGEKVAVKVQKDYIRKQLNLDLLVHRIVLHVFEYAFELPISWSADYIEENLRQEVDFINEAKNSEKALAQFRTHPLLAENVHVPTVVWDYTTPRVLVTEWIDGIPLADRDRLHQSGFSFVEIMNQTVAAFSYQLFHTGFVHADPHMGNILIRRNPSRNSQPQICILDHGLYIQESEEFRRDYCKFWKAVFLMDRGTMEDICTNWGIQDVNIFTSATLQRPYNTKTAIHLGVSALTPRDIYKMQMVTKERIKKFLADTERIPRELIFVGRTLNLVRSNNKHLGSPVNRLNIMASWAVTGIGVSHWQSSFKNRSFFISFLPSFDYLLFHTNLMLMSLSFHANRLVQVVMEFIRGKRAEGFEELLENRFISDAQTKLGIYINKETFNA